jgi:hypothetical protein
MASETNPSIINLAFVGWRDGVRAVVDMKLVASTTFLFVLAVGTVHHMLLASGHLWATVVGVPLGLIAKSLALTPLAIAVHRYVLLNETTRRYALDFSDLRFRRFFGFTLALQAAWLVPTLFTIAASTARFAFVMASLVAFVAVYVVTLRTVILFPAIAIDAPGVGWKNAMDDTRGHTFRVLFVLLLAAVPLWILDGFAFWFFGDSSLTFFQPLPPLQTMRVVSGAAVVFVLFISAFATIASWLYRDFGTRLNGVAPAS